MSYHFYGTHGWDSTSIVAGTVLDEGNGFFSSSYTKDVSTETEGDKVVLVSVVLGDDFKEILVPVEIVDNLPPSNVRITVSAENFELTVGGKIEYGASSDAVDGDMTVYRWEFSNPVKILHGRTVFLDTNDLSPLPYSVQGYLFATDPLGGVTRVAIPAVQVNSPEVS